jgi:hypothetical protein
MKQEQRRDVPSHNVVDSSNEVLIFPHELKHSSNDESLQENFIWVDPNVSVQNESII